MTRVDQLSAQLAQACHGREAHADHVAVHAVRLDFETIGLFWDDTFLRERGTLGTLTGLECRYCVPILFSQMRAWRRRCEGRPVSAPLRASAAAGGGR